MTPFQRVCRVYLLMIGLLSLNTSANEWANIHYGSSNQQTLDVHGAGDGLNMAEKPILVMVHGGGWRFGDKDSRAVVQNKVAHWVDRGFVFISINYRLLPESEPLEQAKDVASALVYIQQHAKEWGASPELMIVMGHSAGAHLVSLLATQPQHFAATLKPWLGTVALDSAAYDVVSLMKSNPPRLYRQAFGQDEANWIQNSPWHQLKQTTSPFLAVCSSKRPDHPCVQAAQFITKLQSFGGQAMLLEQDLSHREINLELGKSSCYTQQVDVFIDSLVFHHPFPTQERFICHL